MISKGCSTFMGTLCQQAEALWREQAVSWPLLSEGISRLAEAWTRSYELDGLRITAQNNPARAVSAGARVDAAAIAARPCFLCALNRPPEQRSISFGEGWVVLCNPAPIFNPHFVVARTAHEPQRIGDSVELMLDLAGAFEGRYTLFYNGPHCGASAPDHLHVQAVRAAAMPFEAQLLSYLCGRSSPAGEWIEWLHSEPVRVGVTSEGRLPTVVLTGPDKGLLAKVITDVVSMIGDVHPAEPEPMLNAFAVRQDDRWVFYLFPRAAHRPAVYGTGPEELLISPGSVDLGGLLIVPRPEDFDRLEAQQIQSLLTEVVLSADCFARLRERLAAWSPAL